MDNEGLSQVYIQCDAAGRITFCDGGYSISNITDFDQWILIDEGIGDRYNLCQRNYFDSLRTSDRICRYKYVNGQCVLRSDEEIEADRVARAAQEPAEDVPATDDTWSAIADAIREGVDTI